MSDLPIESTGLCRTTHNACDCVLERLGNLEALVDELYSAATSVGKLARTPMLWDAMAKVEEMRGSDG